MNRTLKQTWKRKYLEREKKNYLTFSHSKDKTYWQAYNQTKKRAEYLANYYQKRKLFAKKTTINWQTLQATGNWTEWDKWLTQVGQWAWLPPLAHSDRHLLTRQNRWAIEVLLRELKKRGWELVNQPLVKSANQIYLIFSVRLYSGRDFSYKTNEYKSFVGVYRESGTKEERKAVWLWQHLLWREQKSLRKMLAIRPLLFKRRLQQFDQWIKQGVVEPARLIELVRGQKVPPAGYRYSSANHWETRSVENLLASNGRYGVKTDYQPVLDFDLATDSVIQAEQRRAITQLEKVLKPQLLVKTPSGGYHLYLKSTIPLASGKIYYRSPATKGQTIVSGDWQAQGKYVAGALSEGYEIKQVNEFGKIYESQEQIEKLLNRYGFSFTAAEQFMSTRQPRTKTAPLLTIDFARLGAIYYGVYQENWVRVLALNWVRHLGQEKVSGGRDKGGKNSRKSEYYQLLYQGSTGQIGRVLLDKGYRPKDYDQVERAIKSEIPLALLLRRGENHSFLARVW